MKKRVKTVQEEHLKLIEGINGKTFSDLILTVYRILKYTNITPQTLNEALDLKFIINCEDFYKIKIKRIT